MHFIKVIQLILFSYLLTAFSCETKEQNLFKNTSTLNFEQVSPSILSVTRPQICGDPVIQKSNSITHFEFTRDSIVQLWVSTPVAIEILLLPNDELTINLAGEQPLFSGQGSKLNDALYNFNSAKNGLLTSYGDIYNWSQDMEIDVFLKELNAIENKIDELGALYGLQNDHANEIIQQRMEDEKKFLISNYLSNFGRINQHKDLAKIRKAFAELIPTQESLRKYPLRKNYWTSNAYFLFVQQPFFQQEIHDVPVDSSTIRLLSFDKDPFLKELMLVSLLKEDLVTFETYRINKYKEEIAQTLTSSDLKEEIDSLYQETQHHITKSSEKLEEAIVGDYDLDAILDQVLDKNKGKVIYMDIWATWCKPCLEEFKVSTDFKSNFAEDEVTYLYVAAQSQERAWRAMIQKFALKGTHFLLDDRQYMAFTKRFEVGFFPSYYIIDQKGKVVNDVANLSPSNPETVRVINSLMSD